MSSRSMDLGLDLELSTLTNETRVKTVHYCGRKMEISDTFTIKEVAAAIKQKFRLEGGYLRDERGTIWLRGAVSDTTGDLSFIYRGPRAFHGTLNLFVC